MKRIDPKDVIDTLSACLKANAGLPSGCQKEGTYVASEVLEAYKTMDRGLSPESSGSRRKVRREARK